MPDPTPPAFLQDEVDAPWLYAELARLESDPKLAEVYRRLSATESQHATHWQPGQTPPPPSRRARALAALARRFGPGLVLGTLVARERTAARAYANQGGPARAMARQEGSHARVLSAMAVTKALSLPGRSLLGGVRFQRRCSR